MPRQIRNLSDVIDWGLCVGCGACYYNCDQSNVQLVNRENEGIRPLLTGDCSGCKSCLSICPGFRVEADPAATTSDDLADREFGQALEVWEGYAADEQVRAAASSGGILTAISIYCLENEGVDFVLHAGADDQQPWLNRTVQSRSRNELIGRSGSRYAPASPCDSLRQIEQSPRACVFIGKPCDVAAVAMLRKTRPNLDRNLALVLTFFCAGTPSTKGSLNLINTLGISPEVATGLRYRGDGWPGGFRVSSNSASVFMPYEEAWSRLTSFRPLRCNLCPDGLGRLGDLSCGDAWHRYDRAVKDPGCSIILVRTERGREILHRAMEAGYVRLFRSDSEAVFSAQVSLLQRRRELFGRLLGLSLLRPIPTFKNFSLFYSWRKLSTRTKLRTIVGTLRRMLQHKWFKRQGLMHL